MADRVRRAHALVDAAFPQPPRLGAASLATAGWSTRAGAGSQWDHDEPEPAPANQE